jgi:aminoglycoside 3-N-acetyltransferase
MQSVAAIGGIADSLCAIDTSSAYDRDGVFGRLIKRGAKVLLLGAEPRAVSLFHFAEEQAQVPYRYWKEFSGQYQTQAGVEHRTYSFYARPLDMKGSIKIRLVYEIMEEQGLTRSVTVGAGKVRVFRADDYIDVASACMREDPLMFLSDLPILFKRVS